MRPNVDEKNSPIHLFDQILVLGRDVATLHLECRCDLAGRTVTWFIRATVDEKDLSVGIVPFIGRRPIAAFGNSDGDLAMLQYTAAGAGVQLMVYVHHDDPDREWAYDRDSHIGRLDMGLDEARERGWTVVSMRDDWKKIFSFEE